MLSRREVIAGAAATAAAPRAAVPMNIVVILADDLGYGDLGCYGSRLIRTPNIDRMAAQGARLTDYYAPANLCTPSRAGLLTGRYPIRTGLANEVINPDDTYGLPLTERTIAALLKPAGYATALVGKWHLGNRAPYWPARGYGFDHVFGMADGHEPADAPLDRADGDGPLRREAHPDLTRLTARFTDDAAAFVTAQQRRPFFLYLAYTAPHLPLDPNPAFRGRSWAYAYGDVVEEMDAGVGRLLATLERLGLAERTLVIFTSDNGPWFEGDNGGLHGRKGEAGYDGGYRVPFIAWAPGRIPSGATRQSIAMGIDILPTALDYARVSAPDDLLLDGRSLRGVLEAGAASSHEALVLFDNAEVAGLRTQDWKIVRRFNYRVYNYSFERRNYPPLFDMRRDPEERYNAATDQPAVYADLRHKLDQAVAEFAPLKSQQLGKPVRGA
jgi:uncharacterized sulfatase